jgi:hypothetical protein
MLTLSSDNIDHTPWGSVDTVVEVSSELPTALEVHPDAVEPTEPSGGGLFTIPLIAIGIGIIAMCLLIPAADENRRLAYERDKLQLDLDHLKNQAATNDAFLKNLANDPTLAERLARRQMKMVPQGTSVLELKSQKSAGDMSPFVLVTVPPPAEMPPYKPVGGFLSDACRHPKTQLYLIGGGMMMIACGVVMGRDPGPQREEDAEPAE